MKLLWTKALLNSFLEAIMNREPIGFLCNLEIQYIIGKHLSLLPLESLRRVLYSKLSWKISSWFLLIFSYVSFPSSKIPISFKITVTQYFLQIIAILLAAFSIGSKTYFLCSSFKYSITASCYKLIHRYFGVCWNSSLYAWV